MLIFDAICLMTIHKSLSILHQKSMELATILLKCKISRVFRVYKKNEKKMDLKNYRNSAINSEIIRICEIATKSRNFAAIKSALKKSIILF